MFIMAGVHNPHMYGLYRELYVNCTLLLIAFPQIEKLMVCEARAIVFL